ncbi:MAG: phosphatase PAP2 family protein [Ferruginibacter sp.]|nr:phosphatase PAP2 family protein [Chitinophagaceae bacterium]
MKKIFFTQLLLLIISAAFGQQNKKIPPPSWGHYKKLSTYSSAPTKGMESTDTIRFQLQAGDTKVSHIERIPPGTLASKAGNGSKPGPVTKQPADLIVIGRKKEPFYLSKTEKFAIPDPPANSSLQTRAELDYLLQLQAQRTEEDIRASTFYAGVYFNADIGPSQKDYARFQGVLFHMGRSIGTWFNADSLPLMAKLIANVWMDGLYYIWTYKNYFLRIRPYILETKLKNTEQTNWAAYPSGHATSSYINAYLFSELIPEFSSFFIKDAYDMAHSREIIGVHFPSDSESGRVLAYQLVQRLLTNEAFKKDFSAVKEEVKKVKATKGF